MNDTDNKKQNRIQWFIFIGAALLIFLDQATKLWIKGFNLFGIHHEGMGLGQSISVIGDFLRITFVENEGMAFGIEFGIFKIILSLFSLIAGILLIYYLVKLKGFSVWVRVGVMFILAGALGNFIDRMFYGVFYGQSALFYGRVVDFIQVDIPDITIGSLKYETWPVFNIADACVTIGVALLLIFHKRIPTFKEVFGKGNTGPEETPA